MAPSLSNKKTPAVTSDAVSEITLVDPAAGGNSSSSSKPRTFKAAIKDEYRKFKGEVHKSTVDPHKSWEARYSAPGFEPPLSLH